MTGFRLALILLAGTAVSLSACPVCSGPMPKPVLNAYLGMTVALSALPIALLGGTWIGWKRLKKSEDEKSRRD